MGVIGPHEGIELELMLAGKKHLALFSDVIPEHGMIAEEIIPESAFAPHVASGRLLRFARTFSAPQNHKALYVCFTMPDHAWRADMVFWLKDQYTTGAWRDYESDDVIVGRLLGYSEEDIQHFLMHQREHRLKRGARVI